MNTQSLSRILTGTLVLIIGVGALLDALNVWPFWQYAGTWWPLSLVAAGLLVVLNDAKQYITALALITIGAMLQINNLDIIDINFWSIIWPVIIIAVGLSILVSRTGCPKNVKANDVDEVSAIFSGNESINNSKNYVGGRATAIFGGVSIDLRDAHITKEATIDVFALCGGIELKVPREWKVQHRVLPILGGVESKSHSEKVTDASPVLYVTGTVALGGVEIKS